MSTRSVLRAACSATVVVLLASAAPAETIDVYGLRVEDAPGNPLAKVVEFRTLGMASPAVHVDGLERSFDVPTTGTLSATPGTLHRVGIVGLRAESSYTIHVDATFVAGARGVTATVARGLGEIFSDDLEAGELGGALADDGGDLAQQWDAVGQLEVVADGGIKSGSEELRGVLRFNQSGGGGGGPVHFDGPTVAGTEVHVVQVPAALLQQEHGSSGDEFDVVRMGEEGEDRGHGDEVGVELEVGRFDGLTSEFGAAVGGEDDFKALERFFEAGHGHGFAGVQRVKEGLELSLIGVV